LRRLHTTTWAPTRASSTAIARPIPWLAPVTIATRSRSVSAENATYWMTECGVATSRVTLICSRSIRVGTFGAISFFQ